MRKLFEEIRKRMFDKIVYTTRGRRKDEKVPVMVPYVFANQLIDQIVNSANGNHYAINYGATTKAAKLMNADASFEMMRVNDPFEIEMVRFPDKEFQDLIESLQQLARGVRKGELKLTLPEYEKLSLEIINSFCAEYHLQPRKDLSRIYSHKQRGHYMTALVAEGKTNDHFGTTRKEVEKLIGR